ncbi:MAG: DMT family transporter [Deltaproteobacteria bacterium]|jgi:drug/metabolite transporter (DMT)-like permease|nr:DMT family transporter [Deltaproteobacteria bacterium]
MAISKRTSIFFLILAPVIWSTSSLLIKSVSWNSWAIAGWRSLVSAFFLWFCFQFVYPRSFSFDWSRANLLVALFYSVFGCLFAVSVKLTTAANAILMQYTAPIYIAFLAPIVLKERTPAKDWLFVAVMAGGMSLFFMNDLEVSGGRNDLLGLLAGMGGGFAWGMVVMLLKKRGADGMPLSGLVLGNFITVIYCFPFMISVPSFALRDVGQVAALALISLGLGYIFYLLAIKQVTALEAALIPAIEPLLNPTWTFLFLQEVPGFWTIVGGFVVLGTVLLKAFLSAREEPAEKTPAEKELDREASTDAEPDKI